MTLSKEKLDNTAENQKRRIPKHFQQSRYIINEIVKITLLNYF